jgi:hypothetical protein
VTLQALLQPVVFGLLVLWSFLVLSAVQLTIRLIMAYSLRDTLLAGLLLSLVALPIAAVYDLLVGPEPTLAARLEWAPVSMVLMGLAGFGVARRVLRFQRLRGQLVAGVMVGLLDPHLFTLVAR